MQIKDIMTKGASHVSPETSVKEAARKMEQGDIGALPVYDGKNLVGLLTDRDIVVRSTSKGDNPEDGKVGSIMTKDPGACRPEESLEEVAGRMKKDRVRRMPVVDADNKIIGMVSMADIILKGRKDAACDILEKVSEPSE